VHLLVLCEGSEPAAASVREVARPTETRRRLRLLQGILGVLQLRMLQLVQLSLHVRERAGSDTVITRRPSVLESTAAGEPALASEGPVATDWRGRLHELHWRRREEHHMGHGAH